MYKTEHLDDLTLLAELGENGTLWLTNDATKAEVKLTPQATFELFAFLVQQMSTPEMQLAQAREHLLQQREAYVAEHGNGCQVEGCTQPCDITSDFCAGCDRPTCPEHLTIHIHTRTVAPLVTQTDSLCPTCYAEREAENVSIDVQRQAIREECRRRGFVAPVWYEDQEGGAQVSSREN